MFEVPRRLWCTLMCRSLAVLARMLGFITMTYAISYFPVSIFNLLSNTCAFFISILKYFILNEKLQKVELISMLIYFSGVLILVNTKTETSASTKTFDGSKYFLGVVLALFQAGSRSIVQVFTRRMKECHFTVIQFNYTFIASSF